jgi:hypothetical protein
MKFEIHVSKNQQYYFILIARNGEVIATSEMYRSKQMCRKGITAVRKALFALTYDMTI